MRKKIAALVAAVNALFVLIVPQTRAVSAESILNRQTAVQLVKNNSTAVWDAREQVNFAKEDYEVQAARSKSIDTEKVFLFVHPFTDEDVYYYYQPAEQVQLMLLKEFVPETFKFSHEVKEMTVKVTENAMANAADGLFTGLYSTYHSVKLAEKACEFAKRNLERQRKLYENGLITGLDLEDAELSLKEAENAVKKAERDYENMHRQFNSLAGLPLDFRYDLIGTPWTNDRDVTITEEEAVARALENRMEIWSTKRQIELIEFRMEIYRYKDVYSFHRQTREDYADAQEELDKLKLTLSQQEYDIEKEIRQAYRDLKKSFNDLELSKLNLARQKNLLEATRKQYEAGLVPVSVIEQLELSIEQLEFAVNMNVVNILNKQDRFYRAISVGPGY
ncbi:MAG: TolC family protein [Clostridiaceae bacterium]|nr:TolC family protein [Clostridiaceae bacterium]